MYTKLTKNIRRVFDEKNYKGVNLWIFEKFFPEIQKAFKVVSKSNFRKEIEKDIYIKKQGPYTVVHTCNPSTLGG